jgi:hypothetical protein
MTEVGVAAAEMGYDILKSSISALQEGDIHYNGPTSTIGVRATAMSDELRRKMQASNGRKRIFSYRWVGELTQIEKVNVKLDCYVQYNGPEVEATFHIPADGNRSRLDNDVNINIGNPLSLETKDMPDGFKALGIHLYPVVRIPVSVFVDRPWPRSNYKESFMLVVSGLWGFGADGLGTYEEYQSWED